MRPIKVEEDGKTRWSYDERLLDPACAHMFEKQPEREQAIKDERSFNYRQKKVVPVIEVKKVNKKQ